MKILENYSMKKHSNLKIGGIAKKFIYVENKNELKEIFENNKNIFLLGNGTNTLIDDRNLDMTFVSLKELDKIEKLEENLIKVESGIDFNRLIVYTNKNNLGGLENLAGIPGTLGGLVCMNGGAYGSEIFDYIESVEIFDENHNIRNIKKEDMNFSYRTTQIKENKWIVLSATFRLPSGYDSKKVIEIQKLRESKQPLDKPNLGSTFKNPNGDFAARLISEAELKNYKVGGIYVSPKHPNFIINDGTATFDDVKILLKDIKNKIKELYNVDLEEEIIIIEAKRGEI